MYQLQLPFGEAVKRALTVNYCNFKGRASRSEYWWFMLFIFIAMIAVSVIFCWSETLSSIALGIVYLGILLPALGLSVRRMHDIGRSGWWLLINFIPLGGRYHLPRVHRQGKRTRAQQVGRCSQHRQAVIHTPFHTLLYQLDDKRIF